MKKINEKLKLKWFHKIPIIGPMIYSVTFETTLVRETMEMENGNKIRGKIKKYKTIFSLSSLVVSLPFSIVFLVYKIQEHQWTWWALGVSLAIFSIQNITPYLYKKLYELGIKKQMHNSAF